MSDIVDLRDMLADWPYDEDANARIVPGADGRDILQVRTPMGIEQYELEGRPDGQEPYGYASALDYHQEQLQESVEANNADAFVLDPDDCSELFHEGTLYYFRYLHLFQLRAWAYVVRDTQRNLGLFDFLNRYAERDEDREHLEKWRPYVLRMNGIAQAMLAAEQEQVDDALAVLEQAIQRIESLEALDDETFRFERGRSLAALRELVAQLQKTRPISEVERLERELRRAIETQEFERAAELRDRIRDLRAKA